MKIFDLEGGVKRKHDEYKATRLIKDSVEGRYIITTMLTL